jgi:hypothetical protein
MPPWFADAEAGVFRNDPRLSTEEVVTIVDWVEAGAPRGAGGPTRPRRYFEPGWSIGKPEAVFKTDTVDVPATGVMPYVYLRMRLNFPVPRWIAAFEIRPSHRSVVHHVIATAQLSSSPVNAAKQPETLRGLQVGGSTPNRPGIIYDPGVARLLPAATDLVLQVHFTPDGQPRREQISVGIKWAPRTPSHQALSMSVLNNSFLIPSGARGHEVCAKRRLIEDTTVTAMMPHMHLRGKSMKYLAQYPDGRVDVLLNVPKFDFGWQLTYELSRPKRLPKGTILEVCGTFDNSVGNRNNPDPHKDVKWGDQTWEEMMVGWFTVLRPVALPRQSF